MQTWKSHEGFAASWPGATQFSRSQKGGDNYHQVWESNMKPKSSVNLLNITAFPTQNNDKTFKQNALFYTWNYYFKEKFHILKSEEFLSSRRINPGNSSGTKWSVVQGQDVICRLVSTEEGTWAPASAMNNLRIHSQHEDIQKHTFRISILDNQSWRETLFT